MCGGLMLLPLIAMGASNVANVTVKVTVIATPPCVVNDNKVIEVEFGDVSTTQVDGQNYRMPVNYSLDCNVDANNALKLQVQGNAAAFDGKLLQTDTAGLAIKLQKVGGDLPINTWLNFNYPNKQELWAVPIKEDGVTLQAGEFNAAATMRLDYQ